MTGFQPGDCRLSSADSFSNLVLRHLGHSPCTDQSLDDRIIGLLVLPLEFPTVQNALFESARCHGFIELFVRERS